MISGMNGPEGFGPNKDPELKNDNSKNYLIRIVLGHNITM
jgi:hypothetical protein